MERYLPLTGWRKWWAWLGFHVHDPRVFCFGNIATVKCTLCGMESIPWEVTEDKALAWREAHPNAAEEYNEIDRRIREND